MRGSREAQGRAGLLPGLVFQTWVVLSCAVVLLFIAVPLARTVAAPTLERMLETVRDAEVLRSVGLSLWASALAAVLVPILYFLVKFVMVWSGLL